MQKFVPSPLQGSALSPPPWLGGLRACRSATVLNYFCHSPPRLAIYYCTPFCLSSFPQWIILKLSLVKSPETFHLHSLNPNPFKFILLISLKIFFNFPNLHTCLTFYVSHSMSLHSDSMFSCPLSAGYKWHFCGTPLLSAGREIL